jgi:hypothetical protein
MTPTEFRAALAVLEVPVSRSAALLGVSLRTAYGWSSGEWPIPDSAVMRLCHMLLVHDGQTRQLLGKTSEAIDQDKLSAYLGERIS